MTIDVRVLAQDEIAERLDDLATLRMAVFHDWPYLYDGDREYERSYLRPYAESPRAIVVGAFDENALVGASTGTPMSDHEEGVADAIRKAGLPQSAVFYFAESVLLPAFHGRGLGHRFFDLREKHARRLGFRYAVFAAVVRPEEHPRRPRPARDLAPFWRKRGYRPLDAAVARMSWRDIGDDQETAKQLSIWLRDLDTPVSGYVLETFTP